MTEERRVEAYRNFDRTHGPVESRLQDDLAGHICVGLALGTISCLEDAHRWLRSTFLWVRMQQDPAPRPQCSEDEAAEQEEVQTPDEPARELVRAALARLTGPGMLLEDSATGDLTATAASRCDPMPLCPRRS